MLLIEFKSPLINCGDVHSSWISTLHQSLLKVDHLLKMGQFKVLLSSASQQFIHSFNGPSKGHQSEMDSRSKLKFPHMRNVLQLWGWLLFIILLILILHMWAITTSELKEILFLIRRANLRLIPLASLNEVTEWTEEEEGFSSEWDTAGRIHKAAVIVEAVVVVVDGSCWAFCFVLRFFTKDY